MLKQIKSQANVDAIANQILG